MIQLLNRPVRGRADLLSLLQHTTGARKLPMLASQHMTCRCTKFEGILRWLEALADGRQQAMTGAIHHLFMPAFDASIKAAPLSCLVCQLKVSQGRICL